jgi:Ca-activated chloride channel family protein
MKYLILLLFLTILPGDINKTALINRLKREAEKDFKEKKFTDASAKYRILIDSLGQNDEEIRMNLSHCYFNLKDSGNAYNQYKDLTNSPSKVYQSTAFQQLGVLDTNNGRYREAEENFRNALLANPHNEGARYDYELLKKKMKEQQNKDQKNQDKDQKNDKNKDQKNQQQKQDKKQQDEQNKKNEEKDQQQKKDQQEKQNKEQNKENPDKKKEDQKEAQKKEQEESQKNEDKQKKLMNNPKEEIKKISEDKARMILEAMKNSEEQYLQQRQRKINKKSDSGKPDW